MTPWRERTQDPTASSRAPGVEAAQPVSVREALHSRQSVGPWLCRAATWHGLLRLPGAQLPVHLAFRSRCPWSRPAAPGAVWQLPVPGTHLEGDCTCGRRCRLLRVSPRVRHLRGGCTMCVSGGSVCLSACMCAGLPACVGSRPEKAPLDHRTSASVLLSFPAPGLTSRFGPGGWPLGGAAAPAPQVPGLRAGRAAVPPLCLLPGRVPVLSITFVEAVSSFRLPCLHPIVPPDPPHEAWPLPSHSCQLLPHAVWAPCSGRVQPLPGPSTSHRPGHLLSQTAELPRPRALATVPQWSRGTFSCWFPCTLRS